MTPAAEAFLRDKLGFFLLETFKWLEKLLVVIGLLTSLFLLSSATSLRNSLELRIGRETQPASNPNTGGSLASPQKTGGVLMIPVDTQ
jgi:hypothetical protein